MVRSSSSSQPPLGTRAEAMIFAHCYCDGPLAVSCSFKKPHVQIERRVNRQRSSTPQLPQDSANNFGYIPPLPFWFLRDMCSLGLAVFLPHVCLSLSPSHVFSVPLFSLSGSPAALYDAWSCGKLSRSSLSVLSGTCRSSADLRCAALDRFLRGGLQLRSLHAFRQRPW